MNKKFVLTTFIGMILFLNVALAIPGIPHQFYGYVTYNGQPAPDGLSVVAKINGIEVASTTTYQGKYGYEPLFYVPDPNNDRSGDTIKFFVNGVDTGQTYVFQNGGITRLDLTATGSSVTTTTPSGSISGGSSGGGTTTSQTTIQPTTVLTQRTPTCVEKWKCTDWSSCKNAVQTRTCTDENNCGTDLYKPFESQLCVIEETKGESSLITGFVSLLSTPTIIGSIIVIILVVIGLLYFFFRRKKIV